MPTLTYRPPPEAADTRGLAARLAAFLLLVCVLTAWAVPARAGDDPPGRVGRIAWVEGDARLQRGDGSEAIEQRREPLRNWPVTSGDLITVAGASRAEIAIGSTRLRLGEDSELLLRRVDDAAIDLQLLRGRLAVLLRSDEVARELSIDTGAARLLPLGAGLYRVDVPDAGRHPGAYDTRSHEATAWRNALRIEQARGSYTLPPGRQAEIFPEGGLRMGMPEADEFARWAMDSRDDGGDPLLSREGPVSEEMTGALELDRHGDWTRSTEHGWVWYPRTVVLGWAPYRHGRWAWVPPWGWTWIDAAPWGFAPFHYGRWVHDRGRWGWVPGDYMPRPVYAPALVVWSGQPGGSWSAGIGSGVAWFPLAPREVYVPAYAAGPRHVQLINRPHVPDGFLVRQAIERPDDVLRRTPYRYGRFPGAISTVIERPGDIRPAPWRGPVDLPPQLRPPQPPPVVMHPRPEPRERERERFPGRPDRPNPPEMRSAVPRLEPPRPPELRHEPRREWPPQMQRNEGRPEPRPDARHDGRRDRWPPGREER